MFFLQNLKLLKKKYYLQRENIKNRQKKKDIKNN